MESGILTDISTGTKNSGLDAEKAALRLAARAEQTCEGMLLKLCSRGYTREAASIALAALVERNLVNDERFAHMWLVSRIRRTPDSPRALLARLQSRGIAIKTARAALKNVLASEEELDLLKRYVEKKQRGLVDFDRCTREYLRAEGFSPEVLEEFFNS